jgi:leucyl-tRNA synthetase
VVAEFGADSLRVYEMFMGPLEAVKPWQTAGIQGCRRFLDRVHAVASRPLSDDPLDLETAKITHRTVKQVTRDIEGLRFNTAVAKMMEFARHLNAAESPPREGVERLLLCLSPFAPHLAEELWEATGHAPSIANAPWPAWDEKLCIDDVVEIAVQVNGKVRGRIEIARNAAESVARDAALADPNVQKFIAGKPVKKFVYVAGRIANLIVG